MLLKVAIEKPLQVLIGLDWLVIFAACDSQIRICNILTISATPGIHNNKTVYTHGSSKWFLTQLFLRTAQLNRILHSLLFHLLWTPLPRRRGAGCPAERSLVEARTSDCSCMRENCSKSPTNALAKPSVIEANKLRNPKIGQIRQRKKHPMVRNAIIHQRSPLSNKNESKRLNGNPNNLHQLPFIAKARKRKRKTPIVYLEIALAGTSYSATHGV